MKLCNGRYKRLAIAAPPCEKILHPLCKTSVPRGTWSHPRPSSVKGKVLARHGYRTDVEVRHVVGKVDGDASLFQREADVEAVHPQRQVASERGGDDAQVSPPGQAGGR